MHKERTIYRPNHAPVGGDQRTTHPSDEAGMSGKLATLSPMATPQKWSRGDPQWRESPGGEL